MADKKDDDNKSLLLLLLLGIAAFAAFGGKIASTVSGVVSGGTKTLLPPGAKYPPLATNPYPVGFVGTQRGSLNTPWSIKFIAPNGAYQIDYGDTIDLASSEAFVNQQFSSASNFYSTAQIFNGTALIETVNHG